MRFRTDQFRVTAIPADEQARGGAKNMAVTARRGLADNDLCFHRANLALAPPATGPAPRGAALEIRVTDTPAAMDRLEADWSALFKGWGASNYFMSFDWCRSWWEMLGACQGGTPVTISIWHRRRLVALMALAVTRVGPLVSAEAMGGETGQYSDILVARNFLPLPEIFDALLRGLEGLKIDCLQFTNVRDDSTLARFLRHHRSIAASPLVNCEVHCANFENFDTYMQSRSANTRKNLRRRRRKLEERGSVTYEVVTDPRAFQEIARTIVTHKLEWLAARGLHGRFLAKPGVARWFVQVCHRALASGHLHLSVLRVDEAVVACQLAFICDKRLTCYFASFDIGYAGYAVGRMQTQGFIEELFDDALVIDLMPPKDTYKLDWGEEGTPARDHTLPVTRLGTLVCLAHNARSRVWVKKLYLSLPRAVRAPAAVTVQRVIGWLKKSRHPQTNKKSGRYKNVRKFVGG